MNLLDKQLTGIETKLKSLLDKDLGVLNKTLATAKIEPITYKTFEQFIAEEKESGSASSSGGMEGLKHLDTNLTLFRMR